MTIRAALSSFKSNECKGSLEPSFKIKLKTLLSKLQPSNVSQLSNQFYNTTNSWRSSKNFELTFDPQCWSRYFVWRPCNSLAIFCDRAHTWPWINLVCGKVLWMALKISKASVKQFMGSNARTSLDMSMVDSNQRRSATEISGYDSYARHPKFTGPEAWSWAWSWSWSLNSAPAVGPRTFRPRVQSWVYELNSRSGLILYLEWFRHGLLAFLTQPLTKILG